MAWAGSSLQSALEAICCSSGRDMRGGERRRESVADALRLAAPELSTNSESRAEIKRDTLKSPAEEQLQQPAEIVQASVASSAAPYRLTAEAQGEQLPALDTFLDEPAGDLPSTPTLHGFLDEAAPAPSAAVDGGRQLADFLRPDAAAAPGNNSRRLSAPNRVTDGPHRAKGNRRTTLG
eukprot:gb/GFBE01039722.1/.p1 GENE.gb/GFBE01039722.1/~~gb/GFBE01039722.1/.p1  ORF type:complete len:179 (+),score=27.98 gb/GFBE01039722.1/:1-537(+)